MNQINMTPIGVINSPHTEMQKTPIQPVFAKGEQGTVTVFDEFAEGLTDLAEFSHIFLLFHFNQAKKMRLRVKPFLQDVERGVFATRAPCHPNGIGFSVVKLLSIEANILHIEDVDILDGTPLLDIKPYVARFDLRKHVRSGWQEQVSDAEAQKRGRRAFEG
jgi:tRNA-Thr(GGU) m(6)t(6)A37 methyltransferase TsaA